MRILVYFDRCHKMPPQNMPFWHKDYFELKETEKQLTWEEPSAFLLKSREYVFLCKGEIKLCFVKVLSLSSTERCRTTLICPTFPSHLPAIHLSGPKPLSVFSPFSTVGSPVVNKRWVSQAPRSNLLFGFSLFFCEAPVHLKTLKKKKRHQ